MKTVWKYPIGYAGEHTVNLPRCLGDCNEIMKLRDQILFVGNQNDVPTIWVLVDDSAVKRDVQLLVAGTGHDCDAIERCKYIGSVTTHGGNYVWHLFIK